jgi:hypothetical protein
MSVFVDFNGDEDPDIDFISQDELPGWVKFEATSQVLSLLPKKMESKKSFDRYVHVAWNPWTRKAGVAILHESRGRLEPISKRQARSIAVDRLESGV